MRLSERVAFTAAALPDLAASGCQRPRLPEATVQIGQRSRERWHSGSNEFREKKQNSGAVETKSQKHEPACGTTCPHF